MKLFSCSTWLSCKTATLDFFSIWLNLKSQWICALSWPVTFHFGKNSFPVIIQPFRLLHVFNIHNQSNKYVTFDFVFATRSMQSVILCSCCCLSAHRSHFACFLRAGGDDAFAINFGCWIDERTNQNVEKYYNKTGYWLYSPWLGKGCQRFFINSVNY